MSNNYGVIAEYSEDIKSKQGTWLRLAEHATHLLQTEVLRYGGGIVPPVLVKWSISNFDNQGKPVFLMQLLDGGDDQRPITARFPEASLVNEDSLRNPIHSLYTDFLHHRLRIQATNLNTTMSGGATMIVIGAPKGE